MKPTPISREPENFFTKRREPLAFLLWAGIAGIVLIFLILVALYLMRRNQPDWEPLRMPWFFYVSTAVIATSSLVLMQAKKAFRDEKFKEYTRLLGITLLLGVVFVVTQLLGWKQLLTQGIFMENSTSGAFLYVISGLHVAHILGGLFFLSVAFREALRQHSYVDAFVYSVNPPNQLKLKLLVIYWHFVDVLWLCLFVLFWLAH